MQMFEYAQDALLLATASNPTMDARNNFEITLTGTQESTTIETNAMQQCHNETAAQCSERKTRELVSHNQQKTFSVSAYLQRYEITPTNYRGKQHTMIS